MKSYWWDCFRSGFLVLIWIRNSIYIIKEWERGVVLRVGNFCRRRNPAVSTLCSSLLKRCIGSVCGWRRWTCRPQDIITHDNVS
jgi:hypothetical protein